MAVAEHLATRGAEAISADGKGGCLLHFAATHGYVAVAEHLTARGAEASVAEGSGLREKVLLFREELATGDLADAERVRRALQP